MWGVLWEQSPDIFSYLANFLSQMYLVIKHFLSAWSGPGRVSFHKHWQVNLTALPVSAGGFICIVIVLVKQNNRLQFMERSIRGAGARRMRRPFLPRANPEETRSPRKLSLGEEPWAGGSVGPRGSPGGWSL